MHSSIVRLEAGIWSGNCCGLALGKRSRIYPAEKTPKKGKEATAKTGEGFGAVRKN